MIEIYHIDTVNWRYAFWALSNHARNTIMAVAVVSNSRRPQITKPKIADEVSFLLIAQAAAPAIAGHRIERSPKKAVAQEQLACFAHLWLESNDLQ
jgi:hypothetical protein